jgi:hypothetical protein
MAICRFIGGIDVLYIKIKVQGAIGLSPAYKKSRQTQKGRNFLVFKRPGFVKVGKSVAKRSRV